MRERFKHWPQLNLALALFTAATLSWINIAKSSIWHDEGYSMMLSAMPSGEIISRTARDVHPPLYYLLLHAWTSVFGSSEAAARSLSLVCLLVVIVMAYLLMRRLFNASTAVLSAWVLALAPFLIRYAQEARMYALLAALVTGATYALVRAHEPGAQRRWWVIYSLLLAAGFYTHYYTIFVVLAHAVYTLIFHHSSLRRTWWWGANLAAAVLFLPWAGAAWAQFNRVQSAFWIPPVGAATLPNSLMQFLSFTNLSLLPVWLRAGLALGLIAVSAWAIKTYPKYRAGLGLLMLWLATGPVLVFGLSLTRPIYVDRYFVFASVGFYLLLAALLALPLWQRRRLLRATLVLGLGGVLAAGIGNVYSQANHQMRTVANVVNQQYQPGDLIVSGELYTYFDFSYYNRTSQPAQLLAPDGISGYGETSLFWGRADEVVISDYSGLLPSSGYVWVVGKTGAKNYFSDVPPNWEPVGPRYEAGYSAAQRFRVNAPSVKTAHQVK